MAFCTNCGKQMSEAAPVCAGCGRPRGSPPVSGAAIVPDGPKVMDGGAIASLILGILNVIMLPLILGIPAVIIGGRARRRISSDPSLDGGGLALAGIILGWLGIVFGLALIIGATVLLLFVATQLR